MNAKDFQILYTPYSNTIDSGGSWIFKHSLCFSYECKEILLQRVTGHGANACKV